MATKRFATLTEDEIVAKKKDLTPKATQSATNVGVRLFREYLIEKELSEVFEAFSKAELDKNLGSFYLEARTKSGEKYKVASLKSARYAINRFLKSPPNNKTYDIVTDPDFAHSNDMFKVAMRELKAEGRADTVHYPHMSDVDLKKVYTSMYLSPQTPCGLYNKSSSTSATTSVGGAQKTCTP